MELWVIKRIHFFCNICIQYLQSASQHHFRGSSYNLICSVFAFPSIWNIFFPLWFPSVLSGWLLFRQGFHQLCSSPPSGFIFSCWMEFFINAKSVKLEGCPHLMHPDQVFNFFMISVLRGVVCPCQFISFKLCKLLLCVCWALLLAACTLRIFMSWGE